MDIKKRAKELQPDVVKDLTSLVSYYSVFNEGEEGTPFGVANRDCLKKALEIAEGYGFRTKNCDDYCGYAEIGEGDEIIGILAHLDVVPCSDTWATDPTVLTYKDGKYYGRGATDDKGAGVCAMHAMRIIKETGVPLNKRIRLIWGCNEENGSNGIKHYIESGEEVVSCGFTPDGYFPVIYGEKGICSGTFSGKSEKILDIKGGTVSNAVAAKCEFTLAENSYDTGLLKEFLDSENVKFTIEGNKLTVFGVDAHAMSPELGVNAISYGLEALYKAGIDDVFVTAYHDKIGLTYNGEKLGVDFVDEYSNLTYNVGLAYMADGNVTTTFDIRFPVTKACDEITEPLLKNGEGYIKIKSTHVPLFFDPESPMIKSLLDAYYKVKGNRDDKPLVIGGGTYAKVMPNIVAFGCEDMNVDSHIHDDNEFASAESLLFQTETYAEAILNLLKI